MGSYDRAFANTVRHTERLEAALAEWDIDETADLMFDDAPQGWFDAELTGRMLHEERLGL